MPSDEDPSEGCGLEAGQQLGQWVEQPDLMIQGVPREWSVWLPNDYDPARAYPLVMLFHGCSSATNNVPMENVTDDQAILVRGAGVSPNVCWDASSNGPDIEFFDAMVAELFADRCIDRSRVFGVGYSSGSWLLNALECVRGDVLRANGTVAGGTPGPQQNCVGSVARAFIHDVNDESNGIGGNIPERDRLLMLNGCTEETVPQDPEPCVRYQGCDEGYPVIWCETSGEGHGRQDGRATEAFWSLFTEL